VLLLERTELIRVEWTQNVILLMSGVVVGLLLQYLLAPTMMQIAGATFYNLSLLSSDTFAMVISVLLFNRVVTVPYILSSLLIFSGIIVYQLAPEPRKLVRRVKSMLQPLTEQQHDGTTDIADVNDSIQTN